MTTYSVLISPQQPHDDGSQMTEVSVRRDGSYFPRAAQACLHRNHLGEYAFVFVPGDARLVNEPTRQADYTSARTGCRTYDFDSHEDALAFLRDLYGIVAPDPEPECWLCEGGGEVETLKATGEPVTVGCPACVQRDRDILIERLRAENDDLRRRLAAKGPASFPLTPRSVPAFPAPLVRDVASSPLPRVAGTTERAAFFDASTVHHPDHPHPRNTQ